MLAAWISQVPKLHRKTRSGSNWSRHYLLPLAILAFCGFEVAASDPARAEIDYPYCIKVYNRSWYVDCRFSTMAQCQATASGRSAECYLDPFYKGKPGSPYYVGPTYLPSGGLYGPEFYAGADIVAAPRASKRSRRHHHHHHN